MTKKKAKKTENKRFVEEEIKFTNIFEPMVEVHCCEQDKGPILMLTNGYLGVIWHRGYGYKLVYSISRLSAIPNGDKSGQKSTCHE